MKNISLAIALVFSLLLSSCVSVDKTQSHPKSKKEVWACIYLAGKTYDVPPAVLYGIYRVKRGEEGQEYGPLPDGSYDLGIMRINTSKIPSLATSWNVDENTTRQRLRNDPCINVGTAGWLLRTHLDKAGNLPDAIALYNEGTEEENSAFKREVIKTAQEINGIGKEKGGAVTPPDSLVKN